MTRKPMIPEVVSRAGGADKGLAVKDGLREVRFNVKLGAKKLIEAVEAATHTDEAVPGPLGPLGKPLNFAVRKAASLLSNVDHAAVDLLAPDAGYRAMAVPLRPSGSYFGTGAATDLRTFTTDHHWRYRHWLATTGRDDVFVHEQTIAVAGADVAAAALAGSFAPSGDGATGGDVNARATAALVRALARAAVLSKAARLPGDAAEDDDLPELQARGAVVAVLAGEVAFGLEAAGEHVRYAEALRLADEIALAERDGWQAALHASTAIDALGRWFAFVARHL